jgi:aspartate aminotransferase
VRAFQGGQEIEMYLAHARRILAALGRYCAACLAGAGARVHIPEGAFYLVERETHIGIDVHF